MPSSDQILLFVPFFVIVLLSVAMHEFAHCWINDRLGDDTARLEGRVTLNPLKHLDPMGTLMMLVSAFAGIGFGWGKASPFNPANFRNPARDRMLGAIAGPLSNLIMMLSWASLAASLPFLLPRTGDFPEQLFRFCALGVMINASLALFNLLPIYPLDGHHLLSYLAPREWRTVIDSPAWGYLFLAIVLIPQLRDAVFGAVLLPAINWVMQTAFLLVGISS